MGKHQPQRGREGVATMSASRAEEEEGNMGPRPVEHQARMLGHNNGAGGKHENCITKIEGKHVNCIAKIGANKII